MTPAERQLVSDLFDRLTTLEDAPRDPDAEGLIRDGLRQAPNAPYALVQTVLVQDEALKRANARIQELESELGINKEPPRQGGGFLDTMRDSIFGRREQPRGSVPNVRPGEAPMGVPPGYGGAGAQPMGTPPGYGYGGQGGPPPEPPRAGGSFLGTAAAAAAGVIGGSLLLDSIRGMTGHKPGGGFGLTDPAAAAGSGGGSPWGGGGGNDDLARQLGRDDIGRSSGNADSDQSRQGLFNDTTTDDDYDSDFDDGGGFDGGGDGGGD